MGFCHSKGKAPKRRANAPKENTALTQNAQGGNYKTHSTRVEPRQDAVRPRPVSTPNRNSTPRETPKPTPEPAQSRSARRTEPTPNPTPKPAPSEPESRQVFAVLGAGEQNEAFELVLNQLSEVTRVEWVQTEEPGRADIFFVPTPSDRWQEYLDSEKWNRFTQSHGREDRCVIALRWGESVGAFERHGHGQLICSLIYNKEGLTKCTQQSDSISAISEVVHELQGKRRSRKQRRSWSTRDKQSRSSIRSRSPHAKTVSFVFDNPDLKIEQVSKVVRALEKETERRWVEVDPDSKADFYLTSCPTDRWIEMCNEEMWTSAKTSSTITLKNVRTNNHKIIQSKQLFFVGALIHLALI
jgi:hypothetical protein